MPAEVPHSRCSGSPLNRATPPPNRAETPSPAASHIRGMVTIDCQPTGAAVAAPPPAPVVGASTRVSRLHTRYILRPVLGVAWADSGCDEGSFVAGPRVLAADGACRSS